MSFRAWIAACVILSAMTVSMPAKADNYQSFVSGSAPDTNVACTRAAPCNKISQALARTYNDATIVCIDAPINEALSITKGITIDCAAPGALAGPAGTGGGMVVSINIGSGSIYKAVRLRGLTIDCGNGILHGIKISDADSVTIENVRIFNCDRGIWDNRRGGQTKLFVKDSTIENNNGAAVAATAGATGIVVLDNVSLLSNNYGVAAATGNNVVITRSTISGHRTAGVESDPGARVDVSNSVLSHNTTNVQAYGGVRLRENDIRFSNTAIDGATVSMGGNRFGGNGNLGTLPTPASGAPSDVFN